MPTYILCSSLTAEGGQTLHTTPDRMIEVNREIAEFGCKLVGQYATLGIYDFVTIIEAPDNETIAHLSIDLSSRRTVKIMTLPAIPVSDLVGKLKERSKWDMEPSRRTRLLSRKWKRDDSARVIAEHLTRRHTASACAGRCTV